MQNKFTFSHFACILLGGVFILTSCGKKQESGLIILTETESEILTVNSTDDAWRYLPKAKLVAVNPEHADKPGKVLTTGFYSALSPDISVDGSSLVFAAQQTESDPWQIWEMELSGGKSHQIIALPENCTDPAYLPDGKIVFSRSMAGDSLGADHALFTCATDGSQLTRITYHPGADFGSALLYDGRILAISRQLDRSSEPMLYVIRPDGTKGDLYYNSLPGTRYPAKARESQEGIIYFIESSSDSSPGRLVSISQNRPLHSKKELSASYKGEFRSVWPRQSGDLLVTYRKNTSEKFALYTFNIQSGLSEPLYRVEDRHIIDAVSAETRTRPKKLPSEVDTGVKTGLIMCQDINYLDMETMLSGGPRIKASKIEILGPHGSLGVVNAAEDGSFYLKVMADTPIRIQTLDEEGNILHGPCTAIWLRPNERRGCVGCHENHEMAPENRVPLAVRKDPVSLPVHIETIVEKEVELE